MKQAEQPSAATAGATAAAAATAGAPAAVLQGLCKLHSITGMARLEKHSGVHCYAIGGIEGPAPAQQAPPLRLLGLQRAVVAAQAAGSVSQRAAGPCADCPTRQGCCHLVHSCCCRAQPPPLRRAAPLSNCIDRHVGASSRAIGREDRCELGKQNGQLKGSLLERDGRARQPYRRQQHRTHQMH